MFLTSSYGAPLAQRASYLAMHSSLSGPDGAVNYDYIVTNSINYLLIGSRCIPNGAHTNHTSKHIKTSDMHTYIHMYINVNVSYVYRFCINKCVSMHTYNYTYTHTCMYGYIHTYINIHVTCIYTYIHTYIYIYMPSYIHR